MTPETHDVADTGGTEVEVYAASLTDLTDDERRVALGQAAGLLQAATQLTSMLCAIRADLRLTVVRSAALAIALKHAELESEGKPQLCQCLACQRQRKARQRLHRRLWRGLKSIARKL